jgi:hypothetical protein
VRKDVQMVLVDGVEELWRSPAELAGRSTLMKSMLAQVNRHQIHKYTNPLLSVDQDL